MPPPGLLRTVVYCQYTQMILQSSCSPTLAFYPKVRDLIFNSVSSFKIQVILKEFLSEFCAEKEKYKYFLKDYHIIYQIKAY